MFTAKKVLSLALDPFLVALVILVVGLLLTFGRNRVRRAGQQLLVLAVVLLVASSLWPLAYRLNQPLEDDYPVATTAGYETVRFVAVLGGGHITHPGRPPAHWLTEPSRGRLLEGIRLIQQLDDARLIVSGWGPEGVAHAEVAARAAVSLGVASPRIVTLPRPRDTAEELEAIAELVGDVPFFLVTSASHLPRAMAAAQRRGLHPIPAPADFVVGPPSGLQSWIPDAGAIEATKAAIHEYAGRIWYAIVDRAP